MIGNGGRQHRDSEDQSRGTAGMVYSSNHNHHTVTAGGGDGAAGVLSTPPRGASGVQAIPGAAGAGGGGGGGGGAGVFINSCNSLPSPSPYRGDMPDESWADDDDDEGRGGLPYAEVYENERWYPTVRRNGGWSKTMLR